jgi:hypothetical protein
MADPTFQIPKNVIEPIIQSHVQAAVVSALGGGTRLVEIAIERVLSQKVAGDGSPDRYQSSSAETFLQWAVRDCIQRSVKKTLEQELEKQQSVIRDYLTKELAKKNSPIIKQLVEGMTTAFTGNSIRYRINVTAEER